MEQNRNVWIIMSGEFIAGLGMWLGVIGNLEFLQKLVPSDFHKSLILFIGLFVGVVFGPLAGKVVDNTSKKKIMLYSGLVRIISILFMFIAIQTEQVAWMVVYMFVIGLSAAFYFPALQSAIPLIAKEKDLLALNGLHMNVGTIARIIGTALAGILLMYISLFNLYLLTLLSYIFIFICTLGLDMNETHNRASSKISAASKHKSGFMEIIPVMKSVPAAVMGIFLTLIPTTFLGSFNLMILKISEMQHDPAIKGWLYTAEGASFMLGAFVIKKIASFENSIRIMFFSAFAMAVSHLSLYFADIKTASILSFGLFGLAAGAFFPVAATLFQRTIQKEYHGRFFSFKNMLDRVLFQLILVTAGFFLDTAGFKFMVLFFGGISIALVFFFSFQRSKHSEIIRAVEERSG